MYSQAVPFALWAFACDNIFVRGVMRASALGKTSVRGAAHHHHHPFGASGVGPILGGPDGVGDGGAQLMGGMVWCCCACSPSKLWPWRCQCG
eukprot:scaffold8109_cov110-Isochrysis_galbana.AAC.10